MPIQKKHDWSQFVLRIYINASPEKVYNAWTNDKIVTKWFTEECSIDLKTGGRLFYQWLAGDRLEAKIIKVIKNCTFVFPFGMRGEEVAVTFKKDGKGCVCELQQYNMKTTDDSKWSMHRGCIQGWTFFLTNLKAYLEYGIDLRGHDPSKSYKQDYVNS